MPATGLVYPDHLILRGHAFATSNLIGSYTGYAIEMDIPFFIYGEPPKLINYADSNVPLGEYNVYAELPFFRELYEKLQFKYFNGRIAKSVKTAVERELGLYDTISRKKLGLVLWACLFVGIFKLRSWQGLMRLILRKLKGSCKTS